MHAACGHDRGVVCLHPHAFVDLLGSACAFFFALGFRAMFYRKSHTTWPIVEWPLRVHAFVDLLACLRGSLPSTFLRCLIVRSESCRTLQAQKHLTSPEQHDIWPIVEWLLRVHALFELLACVRDFLAFDFCALFDRE